MRKLVATLAIITGIFVGACIFGRPTPVSFPGVIIIEAQSLPITKTLAWDDADTSITNYTVTLDGTVIGSPTVKTQSVTFTTAGAHTLTITATNLWGTSAPTPLAVNVQLPTAASNPRIQ
jgi:hypothetical protein